jgi:hypothetical protein
MLTLAAQEKDQGRRESKFKTKAKKNLKTNKHQKLGRHSLELEKIFN